MSYLEGCTAPMRDENQLHAAVVELIALDNAQDQILDRAELVSRRRAGPGRHLQFRDQARPVQRPELEDFLDAGRDRLGHHLEISELHFAGRQFRRRILLGGRDEQLSAGRHRHEDDSHRQEHPQHHRVQGHLRRARPEQLSRPGEDSEERRQRAQLLAVRLDADRRPSAARTRSPTSR